MIKWLKERYFNDQLSTENKIFNHIHIIAMIGLLFTTVLVYMAMLCL